MEHAVQGEHFDKIAGMWEATVYEVDGICYAAHSDLGERIVSAVPLQGRMLLLKYSSGEERLFDTTLLGGEVFEPLNGDAVFMEPKVEHGFVSWADGTIDVAPEYMYGHSVPYNRQPDWLLAG